MYKDHKRNNLTNNGNCVTALCNSHPCSGCFLDSCIGSPDPGMSKGRNVTSSEVKEDGLVVTEIG